MQECHHQAQRQPQTACRRLSPWPPPALPPCAGRGAGVGLPRGAGRAGAASAAPPSTWGVQTAHRPSPGNTGCSLNKRGQRHITHACRHSAWYLNSLSTYKHFPVLPLSHHSGSNSFTKEGFLLLSVVYRLSWYQCREGNMTTQVMFLSLGNISGFPNKSSRNGFAIYSFKAATIVIKHFIL